MKEISQEEFKDISVKILNKIHEFCNQYGIRYSLAYGSMLGAVRHHGFIPWDDDIDIVMPRPDYCRFVQNFNGFDPHFVVAAPELDWNYHSPYAHVYDNRTLLVEDHSSYRGYKMGIKIDVFPLDGTPTPIKDYYKHINKVKFLNQVLACKRHYLIPYLRISRVKFVKVLLIRLLTLCISYKFLQKKLIILSMKYDFEKSVFVDNIVFSTYYAKRHLKNDYDSYIDMSFERKKYRVAVGYDNILRTIYGDYMVLPPLDKRLTHHNFKAWWK